MNLTENFLSIKRQIEILSNKTKLIVVSKDQSAESILSLINTGHEHFGENRVQESISKWSQIVSNYNNIKLHFIGKLQSNKTKEVYNLFHYMHSLDNDKLASNFSKLESNNEKKLKYFIQVNIGSELQKSGIEESQVTKFYHYCKNELKINVIGLMCIPPVDLPSDNFFIKLKELADVNNLKDLSMGMSGDFHAAIKYGSTFVRIGSAIFK
jgi:pyridoxal phosphate enzyme (YggS family)